MELEEFKQKFNLPRISEYVALLSQEQKKWFWELLWEIKQVFPEIDIYHAGSSKYGYLGFGRKKVQAKRVEDFLFVLHLEKNGSFILYITDQTYRLLRVDEGVLLQGYDPSIQKELNLKGWLDQVKTFIEGLDLDYSGEDLYPVNYEVEDYFTTLEAYNFLKTKYQKTREATKKIVGFRNNSNRELALILENSKPSLFIGVDPEDNQYFQFKFIDNNSKIFGKYDENEGRHDGLKSHAPSLSKGNEAYYIQINSLNDLRGFCEWYELDTHNSPVDYMLSEDKKMKNKVVEQPLNRILFGAAGTGKTFSTINHALSIFEGKSLEELKDEKREKLKERFDKYKNQGRIKFVTFHQSFSYEDFVEGIRAETDEQGNLTYKVKSGVFKDICEKATGVSQQAESIDEIVEKFLDEITETPLELHTQQNKKFKVSYVGSGVTLQCQPLASEANATYYANISKIKNLLSGEKIDNAYNRSYIKAVAEYLKPKVKPVKRNETNQDYILIIDEINRGNISRIFGELITLIEDTKRAGAAEELSVFLPYSKQEFTVPQNVYIIGTMNSSDRSLTGLDIALRRRFTFIEMPPKPEEIKDENGGLIEIHGQGQNGEEASVIVAELLKVMNQRIEVLLDRDHCIGHANFMSLRKQPTLENLAHIFKQKIIPQLQEYFFDDWSKISLVLYQNDMIIEDNEMNNSSLFPANAQLDMDYSEQKKVWKINDEAFKTMDAFIKILGTKG